MKVKELIKLKNLTVYLEIWNGEKTDIKFLGINISPFLNILGGNLVVKFDLFKRG